MGVSCLTKRGLPAVRLGSERLDEVPGLAVKVIEDGDGAVGFAAGCFAKNHSGGEEGGVVAVKVVGEEEKGDGAAGLRAHRGDLAGGAGAGEEQAGGGGRMGGAGRGEEHPAFFGRERRVLDDREAKFAGELENRLVVVADQIRDGGEVDGHDGGYARLGFLE